MKAVFTCDDVFDILTREPFPSGGANDEFVESHLAVCHECRHLAEAFRPAVGLFHESLAAGFDDELPMYRGRLKPIIESLNQAAVPARRGSRHTLTLSPAAIAASLVLVGAVVFAIVLASPRTGDSVPVAATVRVIQDRDYTLLAALEIPNNCRPTLEYFDRVPTAEFRVRMTQFVCCTKCHHAASRVASTNLAISKTSAACAACHDRMLGEALSMVVPCNQLCESLLAYAPIHNL